MVNGWIECPITDVLKPDGIKIGPFGSQLKKEMLLDDGKYKVYGQENVYSHDFTLGSRFLSEERYDKLNSCEIVPGDFLMSAMGTIGKCAIVPRGIIKGIMDSHLIRLRFDTGRINPLYVLQLFSDNYTYLKEQVQRLSVGGIMDGLSVGIVSRLTVRFPESRKEQERIVKSLSGMDELIAQSELEVHKWQAVKQGCLQRMFPQKGQAEPEMRLPGFTGAWAQRQLGEVFVKSGSGGTPLASQREYYGGGIPFLSISDIDGRGITRTAKTLTKAGLDSSAAWVVPAGAVSLAMYASVGKVGILGMDSATSQAFYNMVFDDDALRDFVYYRLVKADLEQEWEPFISTGTQRNLNAQKVKNFPIQFPTQREEIRVIGLFFRKLDDFVACRQRQVEKYRNLKQGMMEELLSGHTRLTEGDDAQ